MSTRATLAAGAAALAAGIVLVAVLAGPRQGLRPTVAASPSVFPTPLPTASASSPVLGTRDAAISFFEAQGFSGEQSQTDSGRPRWLATHAEAHATSVAVIGPAAEIDELELVVVLTDTTAGDAGRLLGQTLLAYAPDAAEWVADNLAAARAGDKPAEQFGGLTVSLDAIAGSGGTVVILDVRHD